MPLFQISTFILLLNVAGLVLFPPLLYALTAERRIAGKIILVLNSLYLHAVAFLALYKASRKIDFDFNFLRYNLADTLPALWKLYAPWLFVAAGSLLAAVFLQRMTFAPVLLFMQRTRSRRWLLGGAFFLCLSSQVLTPNSIRGSAARFAYASFLSDRRLRTEYRELYHRHIDALRTEKPRSFDRGHPSTLGDAVFLIKQESLNGFLVQSRITPQLLRAADDGILFRNFYGNSVQSIRGYECILCGVPPNIEGALVDEYSPEEIHSLSCLPRIFRSLGYHALYFFGGSHNARIVQFAQSIGFDKILADDIMRPEDEKFQWGYREDLFYTRTFEYLRRYRPDEKLFVFIDTGATNHIPFKVLDKAYLQKVPFPKPADFTQRLSNTTFVQDAYFGHFYDLFKERYASRGSVLVASDHSWPMSMHRNNIFNERGAFEENFRIALLFIPPSVEKQHFSTGTIVTGRYSQMDIFPTILDLMGLEQRHLLGESFSSWLLASEKDRRTEPQRPKLLVQPYGGGYISAVRYPDKCVFDVLGDNYSVFDLAKDPGELAPTLHSDEARASLLREFFLPLSFNLAKERDPAENPAHQDPAHH
jgi:arylsulfatase A-like enzyme